LAFVLGIILYDFIGLHFSSTFYLAIFFSFLCLTIFLYNRKVSLLLLSNLLLGTVFIAGITVQHFSNTKVKNQSLWQTHQDLITVEGIVKEVPIKRNRIRTTLDLKGGSWKNKKIELSGNLLTYFEANDSIAESYKPGDRISIQAIIREIDGTSNPKAFDFEAYLRNRRIDFQCFVKENSHTIVAQNELSYIANLSSNLRDRSLSIFSEYLDGRNLAVANAMILGYKNLLDDELYTAYTESGAVHVLAVSGLHVGIIAYLFILLFSKIQDYNVVVKIIKTISLIFLVSFFALMSGSAPAVVRATIMFSLYIIAKYWLPNYNIYNILAISAIFMLLYDPNVLYQASFQFSYLALTSIVFFQPLIANLWVPKNKIINYFWGLAAVAIAAQILVFPVTIFYFHKFPAYFILSGLIVIPAALVILPLGLSLLISSLAFGGAFGNLIAYVLDFVLTSLNYAILTIQKLPFASLNGLWIDWVQMTILYLALLAIILRFVTINSRFTYWCGSLMICFFILSGFNKIEKEHQSKLVIYDLYNGYLIDAIDGSNAVFWKTDNVDEKSIKFVAKNNREELLLSNLIEIKQDTLIKTPNMSCALDKCQIGNENFNFLTRQNINYKRWAENDRLILIENLYDSHIDVLKTAPFKELVVPRNISYKCIERLKDNFDFSVLRIVAEEGSIIYTSTN
jgi:competence protein ComEC